MKFKSNLDLRLYQQAILGTASVHNALVVIPTGLGKTFIAIGLASLLHEKGKIIIMAPTKPLCVQHKKTFENFFEGELTVMTGAIAPEERKKLWEKSELIFATPQTVENDILRRYLDLKDFSLLVFDEAHRATGDYAYSWIAKQYAKIKSHRILALTASPASEKDKLKEVCSNLNIRKIEVRSPTDMDVKNYVQKKDVEKIDIELPTKLRNVKITLEGVLKQRLRILKKGGVIASEDVDKVRKVELLRLIGSLANQSDVDRNAYFHLSVVAECLKLQHALLLLQTQGVSPLVDFFKKLEKQAGKTKAAKRLVTDWNFKTAMMQAYEFRGEQGEHPKFKILKELVKEHAGDRIIVFTQYRSTVKKIASALSEIEGVIPAEFIGQSKGMSQKEQVATIQKFRDGEVNALVCTNIGEEGLDIPAVPLGILFEPVPSALRSIQRIGRVGRTNIGKIYVLVTKDTLDEKYYWVAKRKEARMHEILDDLKDEIGKQRTLEDFE
jgi:Fanconi anemia group M protein